MTSSAWTERHLSELNELFDLARHIEQKILSLKHLSTEHAHSRSVNPELYSLPRLVSLTP